MRSIGNICILIGQLMLLGMFLFVVLIAGVSYLLGCTGGFTSAVLCENAGPWMENILSEGAGIAGISSFILLPVTAPFFALGFIIKSAFRRKEGTGERTRNTLDDLVSYFGKLFFTIFKLILAVGFWWVTILFFIYFMFKNKSLSIAYLKLKDFIFG